MLLKKWIGLFGAAGLVAASAVAGCSSSSSGGPAAGDDGGTAGDVKTSTDAKSDRVTTGDSGGGGCTPQPVTNPTQPTPAYHPYRKTPDCTTAQITAFDTACVADAATSATCQAWESDAANTACDACLITKGTDANWGPIIAIAQKDIPFNIAGCFGITLNEGASTTGCGAARWGFDRCLRTACPIANCCADTANCTPAEEQSFSDCRQAAFAAGGPCEAASTDLTTKCAGLNNDATAAILDANCPLGDNVTIDQFMIAMGKAFCGGGTGDAGGGG